MGTLPPSLAVELPYESNPSVTELGHTTATERDLYRALKDEARKIAARFQRPISVLDICAASGGAAWHIGSAVRYRRLVLVDMDPLMCEAARKRSWGTEDVEIVLADAVEWRGSEPFDLILANSAYHHIQDDRKTAFLMNLAAQLAPGGNILVGEHFLPDYADGDIESYRRSVQGFYEARVAALQEAGDAPGAIEVIRQTGRYCWERRYEYQVSRHVFVRHLAATGLRARSWKRIWPAESGVLPEDSGSYLISLALH
ncbi:class I SAM-dependent methyltransferase [Candidatus Thiosymbion oneisti]|uniref:class I SAM-dependent methyltransferase n=1 Tax=Candidatus Thiosymbion oneisti TaxID=589554 RepID=UPI000B7D6A5B|nr:class I SAM-dependent methyltransferase [Candidatus Thiosymbion oneisti]